MSISMATTISMATHCACSVLRFYDDGVTKATETQPSQVLMLDCVFLKKKQIKMSIATAQLNYSFGLKGEVSQNASYVDEQTILYPAGRNLILFNTDQKVQRFLPFYQEGGEGASAMALSSNRRYAAVAEKHPEKPSVTVFDLHSMRKRKVLTCPDVTATEYVSLAFSPDSKYLVGQGGGPEWILVYWHWEKAKPMAHAKVSHTPVYQV